MDLVFHTTLPRRVRASREAHSRWPSSLSKSIPANSLMSFCSKRLEGGGEEGGGEEGEKVGGREGVKGRGGG